MGKPLQLLLLTAVQPTDATKFSASLQKIGMMLKVNRNSSRSESCNCLDRYGSGGWHACHRLISWPGSKCCWHVGKYLWGPYEGFAVGVFTPFTKRFGQNGFLKGNCLWQRTPELGASLGGWHILGIVCVPSTSLFAFRKLPSSNPGVFLSVRQICGVFMYFVVF